MVQALSRPGSPFCPSCRKPRAASFAWEVRALRLITTPDFRRRLKNDQELRSSPGSENLRPSDRVRAVNRPDLPTLHLTAWPAARPRRFAVGQRLLAGTVPLVRRFASRISLVGCRVCRCTYKGLTSSLGRLSPTTGLP